MNTVRSILCGAATGCMFGYLSLWVTTALLVTAVDGVWLMVIPAGLIGGGVCGHLYAKKRQLRTNRVVQVLPERAQDGARATAA